MGIVKDCKVIVLKKEREKNKVNKKWISIPGVVLAVNKKFITVKHKNYVESYLISDFISGNLRIKA